VAVKKQRIALGRVILKNPRILVLDEANQFTGQPIGSFNPGSTEPRDGRTDNIVIAHRLSTILAADLILVLDLGHIVERGYATPNCWPKVDFMLICTKPNSAIKQSNYRIYNC